MPAKINLKKPYAEMCGEPGVAFLQGGDFFDLHGNFVRSSEIPKPAPPSMLTVAKQLAQERAAKRLEMIERAAQAVRVNGKSFMDDMYRENARAAAAEQYSAE